MTSVDTRELRKLVQAAKAITNRDYSYESGYVDDMQISKDELARLADALDAFEGIESA